ncbi:MAG TPA: MMPL family transporter [Acidimicrobiales bacterium]
MLQRLARTCFRRRWIVLGVWVVVLFGLNVLANGVIGSNFRTDFKLPDTESRTVFQLLEKANPDRSGTTSQIVFQDASGVNTPEVQQAMDGLFQKVDQLKGVQVVSPFAQQAGGPQAGGQQINGDGTIAFAELNVSDRSQSQYTSLANRIRDLGDEVKVKGLNIEYGGDMFAEFTVPSSELLGILAAVIILLIAFGSVLAMGLPIGTALFGLGTGISLVVLGSHLLSMPDFSTQLAAMIGLGVGIDYALFIVTRYREALHGGQAPEDATATALDTAGRAVLFAGTTVMISLLGMFLIGLKFVSGLAVAGSLAVLTMMLASVTLLPALLGFTKDRIDVTTWRGVIGLLAPTIGILLSILTGIPVFALVGILSTVVVVVASLTFAKRLKHQIPRRRQRPREKTFWYRWSRMIQHRPWPALAFGLIALLVLALPVLSIRLGFGDNGNLPEKQTARHAYDLLAKGFGPGFNGPLTLVATVPAGTDPTTLQPVSDAVAATPDVAFASPPIMLSDDLALWTVYPKSAPQDEATEKLVHTLRDDVLPSTGVPVLVGGITAVSVDFSSYLGSRLPYFIGAVLLFSFILLMAVFRSVVVPLKAVILNLLSIGAAYGVVVAVFQWGWGSSLIGLGRSGPIESWAPMMLFAIVFGLSMDYEVFLLSRIREEYDRTHDNATAVADGLASTARVITAAALVMVSVFASFVLGDQRAIKLFGLGLAVAVLIDATLVRMLLVPATMELLGDRNWWLPKWLDRLLPKLNVDGNAHAPATAPPQPTDPDKELVGASDR